MPRIHATICGAPKTSTVPTIAPMNQIQLMRPNQASAPEPITAMTATGVRIVSMLTWNALAPVAKGLPAEAGQAATRSMQASRACRAMLRGLPADELDVEG